MCDRGINITNGLQFPPIFWIVTERIAEGPILHDTGIVGGGGNCRPSQAKNRVVWGLS